MTNKYPFDLTIVATGDSLRGFGFYRLKDQLVWAINFASRDLPFAKRIVAADGRFPAYPKEIPLHSWRKSQFHEAHDVVWKRHGQKINRDPDFIGRVNHTPFVAINLALKAGFKNIVILGCDNSGARHYYDPLDKVVPMRFDRYEACFSVAAKGCEPDETVTFVETALDLHGFNYISMEDYLAFLPEYKKQDA